MINLHLNIKQLRLAKNFSQNQLANKVGISQSELSKLERNVPSVVKGVKLGTIGKIAKVLNVSINQIIKD